MASPEIEARLEKAKAAAEMIRRMQKCIRSLDQRKDEIFRGSKEERVSFQAAMTRAADTLQGLWVHLHYLSCRLPSEKE